MKTLILAAGRFGDAMRTEIAAGREPRLDVFEIARVMKADLIDYLDVERSTSKSVSVVRRALGASPAVAYVGYTLRNAYDAILTTGEDIGLPLAALLKTSSARCSHTMIAHTLFPRKKRAFFDLLRIHDRVDHVLAYSTTEERLMIDRLGLPADKVQRISYHADQEFFRPDGTPRDADLLCAAGQLLRDYPTLIEAVAGLPVRLQIAAGSPWIERELAPSQALPANVSWGKLDRFQLRALYARSALAVVPIIQNEYQTGIATILEMMSMGKCVIATRTRGQTDTIVDGVSGIYVPPGDPKALRTAIERVLANPAEAARIGEAARAFVENHASLDLFVQRIVEATEAGHAKRFAS